MKILVFGAGARRRALAARLAAENGSGNVWAHPPVNGVNALEVDSDSTVAQLASASAKVGIELAVSLAEAPLFAGGHEAFAAAGIGLFGPTEAAAELERSKAFSKTLMVQAGILTPPHIVCDGIDQAATRIHAQGAFPVVIKEDVRSTGPGVYIAWSHSEALEALTAIGGYAGPDARVIVEDHVPGVEYTVWAFTDGTRFQLLPRAREYKRALDHDRGDNTGGMGATVPVAPPGAVRDFDRQAVERVLGAMRDRGRPYRGLLVVNVLIGPAGPVVLEFNSHWGDPETQALLSVMDGDLSGTLKAAANGQLSEAAALVWSQRHAVWITVAEAGYPHHTDAEPTTVTGDRASFVFQYDAARSPREGLRRPARRLLSVGGIANTTSDAQAEAYRCLANLHDVTTAEVHWRSDIGQ